jgi:hypothetical protein
MLGFKILPVSAILTFILFAGGIGDREIIKMNKRGGR